MNWLVGMVPEWGRVCFKVRNNEVTSYDEKFLADAAVMNVMRPRLDLPIRR